MSKFQFKPASNGNSSKVNSVRIPREHPKWLNCFNSSGDGSYWYQTHDMMVVGERLLSKNPNILDKTVIVAAPLGVDEVKGRSVDLTAVFRNFIPDIDACKRIVGSYNTGGNHWIAYAIWKDRDDARIKCVYKDSLDDDRSDFEELITRSFSSQVATVMSAKVVDSKLVEIQSQIQPQTESGVAAKHASMPSATVTDPLTHASLPPARGNTVEVKRLRKGDKEQSDGSNCGVFTLKNMEVLAQATIEQLTLSFDGESIREDGIASHSSSSRLGRVAAQVQAEASNSQVLSFYSGGKAELVTLRDDFGSIYCKSVVEDKLEDVLRRKHVERHEEEATHLRTRLEETFSRDLASKITSVEVVGSPESNAGYCYQIKVSLVSIEAIGIQRLTLRIQLARSFIEGVDQHQLEITDVSTEGLLLRFSPEYLKPALKLPVSRGGILKDTSAVGGVAGGIRAVDSEIRDFTRSWKESADLVLTGNEKQTLLKELVLELRPLSEDDFKLLDRVCTENPKIGADRVSLVQSQHQEKTIQHEVAESGKYNKDLREGELGADLDELQTSFERYLKTIPTGTKEEWVREQLHSLRTQVASVLSDTSSSSTFRVEQLRRIEAHEDQITPDYKTLLKTLAYTKLPMERVLLSEVLEDLANLTLDIATLSVGGAVFTMKHFTDAAIFHQYVLSILSNSDDPSRVEEQYRRLDQIKYNLLSTIGCGCLESATVSVQRGVTLQESTKHKLFLHSLREESERTVKQAEHLRAAGEEDLYVKSSRALFEDIATNLKDFLALLYKEAEQELRNIGVSPPQVKDPANSTLLKDISYSVVGLGSLALKQATPYSDFEFAILTSSEDYKLNPDPRVSNYFKNLTHLVHLKVINLGETIIPRSKYELDLSHIVHRGINFDLGGKTPLGRIDGDKDYDLVQTVEGMLEYLKGQTSSVDLKRVDQMLPYILEQTCHVYGNTDLFTRYQSGKTAFLHSPVNPDDHSSLQQCQSRALATLRDIALKSSNQLKGDVDKLDPNLSASQKAHRLFDVKEEVYRLPDRLLYSLGSYYAQDTGNSLITIGALYSVGRINIEAAVKHLQYAASFAMMLRLMIYSHYKSQKDDVSVFEYVSQTESLSSPTENQTFRLSQNDLREGGGLFRYFYTAIEIHQKLEEFCEEHSGLSSEERANFFREYDPYKDDSGNNGLILYRLGQYKQAQVKLEEAVADSTNLSRHLYLKHALATIYNKFGEEDKAIKQFEECILLCSSKKEKIGAKVEINIAAFLNNIGLSYLQKGDYNNAIEHFTRSLRMREGIYEDDTRHPDIATSLNNLGNAHNGRKDFDIAIGYHERSLEISKYVHNVHKDQAHSDIAISLKNLGRAHSGKKDYTKAIGFYTESLVMMRRFYHNEPHPEIIACLNDLGTAHYCLKDPDKAIMCFDISIAMSHLVYQGKAHSDTTYALNNLGNIYFCARKYDIAIKHYTQCLAMKRAMYTVYTVASGEDIAISLNNLGAAHKDNKQYDEAIKYYTECLEIRKFLYQHQSDRHSNIAISLICLGDTHECASDHDNAVVCYIKAMQFNAFPRGDVYREHINKAFAKAFKSFAKHHSFNDEDIIDLTLKIINFVKAKQDFTDSVTHLNNVLLQDVGDPSKRIGMIEELRLAWIFLFQQASDLQETIKITILDRLSLILNSDIHSTELVLLCLDGNILRIRELTTQKKEMHPSIVLENDDTTMHIAHYIGSIDTIEILLRAGGKLNTQNQKGETPLHCLLKSTALSSEIKQAVVAKFLSQYDYSIPDIEGKTPTDLAKEHLPEVLEIMMMGVLPSYVPSDTLEVVQSASHTKLPLHAQVEHLGDSVDFGDSVSQA